MTEKKHQQRAIVNINTVKRIYTTSCVVSFNKRVIFLSVNEIKKEICF